MYSFVATNIARDLLEAIDVPWNLSSKISQPSLLERNARSQLSNTQVDQLDSNEP
jgi:hypothetical protein